MEVGQKVMVPRSDGTRSKGTITSLNDEYAVVEFCIGATFRGKPSPYAHDAIGIKSVKKQELTPVN